MTEPLLRIEDLHLAVPDGEGGELTLLRGVSLEVAPGEIVGLVGESGSGKSLTARAVLGMLPAGARAEGVVRFRDLSVLECSPAALRAHRARDVAMVFQDPRSHVNPVRRVRDHLTEGAVHVGGASGADARRRALDLLEAVHIDDPARVMDRYPHELSGGMLQRVMIAGALMSDPVLLLADEPTTALDVTTQAAVMAILADLRRERGLAILFITHDLELAAAAADRTAVMYAGRIVEEQPSAVLEQAPAHPYTAALLGARPTLARRMDRLRTIPGRPADAYAVDGGCAFAPRCELAVERCHAEEPPLAVRGDVRVACFRAGEATVSGAPRG